MRSETLLSSRLDIDEKLLKLCEETHQVYTKAKDSVLNTFSHSASATSDTNVFPDDQQLQSIRTKFIEQLKTGLGFSEN